jgi:hypothetical protein
MTPEMSKKILVDVLILVTEIAEELIHHVGETGCDGKHNNPYT